MRIIRAKGAVQRSKVFLAGNPQTWESTPFKAFLCIKMWVLSIFHKENLILSTACIINYKIFQTEPMTLHKWFSNFHFYFLSDSAGASCFAITFLPLCAAWSGLLSEPVLVLSFEYFNLFRCTITAGMGIS